MSAGWPARRLLVGGSRGILGCSVEAGSLSPPELLAELPEASYLARRAETGKLYAVSETAGGAGGEHGTVVAYDEGASAGPLRLLGAVSSHGRLPCHLALDPSGRFLAVANYVSGSVAMLPIGEDGTLEGARAVVVHEGSSVHPTRQQGAYAHMVCFDPLSGALLVCDLGIDCVVAYGVGEDGELTERPAGRVRLPPGSGPRHLALHPAGRHAFVVNELSNTVGVLRRTAEGFELLTTVPTLGAGADGGGTSTAAAVRLAGGGSQVLVSNRTPGEGSIATFAFDEGSGQLTLLALTPTAGTSPRDFALDAGEGYLVVANQFSDTLALFARDPSDGSLHLESVTDAPAPMCVLWT